METRGKDSAKKARSRDLVHFVSEVKQELKRVDWTTKEELRATTRIVVSCIFLFGFSVYCTDLVLRSLLGSINFLVKWIVG